jgi:hypothetical protein
MSWKEKRARREVAKKNRKTRKKGSRQRPDAKFLAT